MALYPNALKTYQDYLSSGGSEPDTGSRTKWVSSADAPSVPLSTNVESMTGITGDFSGSDLGQTTEKYLGDQVIGQDGAFTGETAGGSSITGDFSGSDLGQSVESQWSDLASMYGDNIVSRGGAENWPGEPPPPEPDPRADAPPPVVDDAGVPLDGGSLDAGDVRAGNVGADNPFIDLAGADIVERQGMENWPSDPPPPPADDRQGVENWPNDPTPPRQGAENWPTDWTNVGDAPGTGGGAGPYGEDVDALIEQALRDLLAGQRDTAEDEAMIQEKIRADMLEGVVDNQARMGALGFGASGALAGMDADIRGRASRDAIDQILGVRDDARDDWLRRVGTGLGADLTRREFASREAARDAYSELLRDMMDGGLDDAEGAPPELGFTDPQEYKDQGFTEVVSSRAGGNSSSPYIVHTVRNPETGETATVTVPYNEGTGWGEY